MSPGEGDDADAADALPSDEKLLSSMPCDASCAALFWAFLTMARSAMGSGGRAMSQLLP